MNLHFDIPNKLIPFVESRQPYQVLYGGRSSGKTATILRKLIVRALEKPITILCTREYQSSIATSTYAELKQLIYETDGLIDYFTVKSDGIVCNNGSQFIFKGLARDIMQIKSIPNISVCFVEEAETIGKHLWEVLDPTLRKNGCELIIAFNPQQDTSATYQEWIVKDYEDDILRIEINYPDNPFNSPSMLKKIERMRINDYARYEHIYLGKVLDMSEDVIFKNKFKIIDMDLVYNTQRWVYNDNTVAPLYGMDFGFSVDPTAMVEVFFLDENTIYINREFYQTKLPITKYIETIKECMPEGLKSKWWADNSRPDTIAQLKEAGLNIDGADKGKGSVNAGIEYLLSKNLIINPRCTNTIYEFYNYKYKTDKNSGVITTDIIDANNHIIDALRYALVKQIQGKSKLSSLYSESIF